MQDSKRQRVVRSLSRLAKVAQRPFEGLRATGARRLGKRKAMDSRFWVVSTYLITAQFVMPFIAVAIAAALKAGLGFAGILSFLVDLVFSTGGCVVGTY